MRGLMNSVIASLLLPTVNAFAASAGDLSGCCAGACPNMHGAAANAGNALTVTGKADGGTYTPGETLTLANTGGGEYALAAYQAGNPPTLIQRQNNNGLTVTAPATGGTLCLLSVRAPGRSACTYQRILLTAAGGDQVQTAT